MPLRNTLMEFLRPTATACIGLWSNLRPIQDLIFSPLVCGICCSEGEGSKPIAWKLPASKIAPDAFNPRHESPPNVFGVLLGPRTRPHFTSRPRRPLACLQSSKHEYDGGSIVRPSGEKVRFNRCTGTTSYRRWRRPFACGLSLDPPSSLEVLVLT